MYKATTQTIHPAQLCQLCRHCGEVITPQLAPGRGPHAAALVCPRAQCGQFLRWVPRRLVEAIDEKSRIPRASADILKENVV